MLRSGFRLFSVNNFVRRTPIFRCRIVERQHKLHVNSWSRATGAILRLLVKQFSKINKFFVCFFDFVPLFVGLLAGCLISGRFLSLSSFSRG